MLSRAFRFSLTFCLLIACSACGLTAFAPPQSQPVLRSELKDKNGVPLYAIATTAERREIYIRASDGRTCFEAPPDAADAVASQFSGAFQAGVKQGTLDANASASLGTS